MSTNEFINQFMSHVLEKNSFKKKEVYLLGDVNINLLNHETDRPTAKCLVIYTQTVLFPLSLSQLALRLDQKR